VDRHNPSASKAGPQGRRGAADGPDALHHPDYFRAIGIPLRQGRFFSDQDRDNSVPVVIISEAMARRFWPGENPIGRRLTPSFHLEQGAREIVGVVGDVKASGLDVDSSAMMYLPYKQAPRPYISFVVRTASNPESLIQPVSKAIYSIDKEQALTDVQTMEQVLTNRSPAGAST
jgi:hypothetical protein